MLRSTKKLIFLFLIPVSTAKQCDITQKRKPTATEQGSKLIPTNKATDTKRKSLKNASQKRLPSKNKTEPVVTPPKPADIAEATNDNDREYDNKPEAIHEEDKHEEDMNGGDIDGKGNGKDKCKNQDPKRSKRKLNWTEWFFSNKIFRKTPQKNNNNEPVEAA